MANEFYNRGATFNPDELADGDAIEAEFDAVARGFDTIGTNIDANKAGYPTQTFHVATATESTHAVPKSQMDAGLALKLDAVNYNARDILTKLKTVDGTGSGLDADLLDGNDSTYYRNASNINAGTLAKERLPASIDASTSGNAATATKVAATAPNGGTADLVSGSMAGNDHFRIRVGGSADAGWTEIATADNGSEPIYVRQYGGVFDSVVRTAALLDDNGNTVFPGYVYAANGRLKETAVLTGVIGNGETIPLPPGYTQDQCKWMVSPFDTNLNATSWDLAENVTARHIEIICRAPSRTVAVYTRIWRDNYNDYFLLTAAANYIIIGVK